MGMSGQRGSSFGAWRDAIKDVYLECSASEALEELGCVRRVCALIVEAPVAVYGLLGKQPDKSRLAALLAVDACDSAVLALMGDRAGYMLSRGANGVYLASVVLPGMEEETSQSGPTLALALVAALLMALTKCFDEHAQHLKIGHAEITLSH